MNRQRFYESMSVHFTVTFGAMAAFLLLAAAGQ